MLAFDIQTITAIASLWKLALVVLMVVGLILFRKQLRALLDRLSHLRLNWGKAGLAINEPELDQKIKEAVEKEAVRSPETAREVGEATERVEERSAGASANGDENLELKIIDGF